MARKTIASKPQEAIGRVGQRRQVVIPRQLFETLSLHEGDFVSFSRCGNGVLVQPRQSDVAVTSGEAEALRAGLKQIKQGKTKSWAQVKDEMGL